MLNFNVNFSHCFNFPIPTLYFLRFILLIVKTRLGREGWSEGREREKSFIYRFTPHMAAKARLGWSQQGGFNSICIFHVSGREPKYSLWTLLSAEFQYIFKTNEMSRLQSSSALGAVCRIWLRNILHYYLFLLVFELVLYK